MAIREFKIKKILILWICAVAIALTAGIVYALDSWDTGFRVNNGITGMIDLSSHSDPACRECKKVTNSAGQDIFIGTKTCAEWNAFKASVQVNGIPSGVTISNCFVCGSLLFDARTSINYNTVQVGTQCWMAENLDIGTQINADAGSEPNVQRNDQFAGQIQKYCRDDNSTLCDDYGGYYQWHEAMNLDETCDDDDHCLAQITYPHQGICPAGWHIPSDVQPDGKPNDWSVLETFLTTSGACDSNRIDWGCDGAGTRVQFGGDTGLNFGIWGAVGYDGNWLHMGDDTHYWTSGATPYAGDATLTWSRDFDNGNSEIKRKGQWKVRGFPVRCVKD